MCIFHMPSKNFLLCISSYANKLSKEVTWDSLSYQKGISKESWLRRSMWVDLKYFQNTVVAEYCKTKLCLTSVPSSSNCCGPGSHLMELVFLADCSRWFLRRWQLVGGCPGQTQRNWTSCCENLTSVGQEVDCAKVLQFQLTVLTPGFFSYNVWVWLEKFWSCLPAVMCDCVPGI